jgi:hypothetical protein
MRTHARGVSGDVRTRLARCGRSWLSGGGVGGGAGWGKLRPAEGDSEGGRGLRLVIWLAGRWGWRRRGERAVTWFELCDLLQSMQHSAVSGMSVNSPDAQLPGVVTRGDFGLLSRGVIMVTLRASMLRRMQRGVWGECCRIAGLRAARAGAGVVPLNPQEAVFEAMLAGGAAAAEPVPACPPRSWPACSASTSRPPSTGPAAPAATGPPTSPNGWIRGQLAEVSSPVRCRVRVVPG